MKLRTIAGLSALMVAAVLFTVTRKTALTHPADFRDAPRSAITKSFGVQAPAGIPEPVPVRVSPPKAPPPGTPGGAPCWEWRTGCPGHSGLYLIVNRYYEFKTEGGCDGLIKVMGPSVLVASDYNRVERRACRIMEDHYRGPHHVRDLPQVCRAIHDEQDRDPAAVREGTMIDKAKLRERSEERCRNPKDPNFWFTTVVEINWNEKGDVGSGTEEDGGGKRLRLILAKPEGEDGSGGVISYRDTAAEDNKIDVEVVCERENGYWINKSIAIQMDKPTSRSEGKSSGFTFNLGPFGLGLSEDIGTSAVTTDGKWNASGDLSRKPWFCGSRANGVAP